MAVVDVLQLLCFAFIVLASSLLENLCCFALLAVFVAGVIFDVAVVVVVAVFVAIKIFRVMLWNGFTAKWDVE